MFMTDRWTERHQTGGQTESRILTYYLDVDVNVNVVCLVDVDVDVM